MKTTITKLAAACLGIAFLGTACSDEFLDVAPTGSIDENAIATEEGVDGLLIGAYAAVNGVFGNRFEGPNHWATGSIMGGEANKGTDAGDYGSLNPIQRYEATPVDPNNDFNNLWKGRYEGIKRANQTLEKLERAENISVENRARISGEARMLRGHFYFDLKKHFNSIPYIDESIYLNDDLDEAQKLETIRTTPNTPDVWGQIEADFQYAFDNLPETTAAGRNNKWAAAAYMGKALLFQKKYAAAKTWFDNVIAFGVTPLGDKYGLLDDFAQIYNAENDQHREAVMDVESANNTFDVNNANWFDDLNYPHNTGPDGPGNCCGFFQPSIELGNSFRTTPEGLPLLDGSYNDPANAVLNNFTHVVINGDDEADFIEDARPLDPRIDHAIGRKGIPYLDWIEHPGSAWIRSFAYAGPYTPKKYIYYRSQENTFTDGSSWTRGYAIMNYTIIRFADVLLMAAEAEIEAGTLEQARMYVNMVRERASNSEFWVKEYDSDVNAANYVISQYPIEQFATKELATEAVRFERKLELSGEGHRFFDLQRWGIQAETLNAYLDYESQFLRDKFAGAQFTPGKNEFYPIPQIQIDLSGETLQQNPGY